jgi:hypothetical protein
MIFTPYRNIRPSLAAVVGVALYCVAAPGAKTEAVPPPESAAPAAPAAPAEPAATNSIGLPQGTVLVPDGHSATEVGAVIVNTLLKRKWVVTSKTDGRILARIDHRGEQATLTVDYSTSQIDFYAISAAPGKAKGAAHVPGWVSNLRKDLNKYFTPKAAKK